MRFFWGLILMMLSCCTYTLHAQSDEQRLYAPGDYGSRNWRIPAVRCLADSSILIVNDMRKFNEGDLPEDIDVVCRRSTDGGRTWSEPLTIARGTGVGQGYGDPALVETRTGEVLCAFAGGNGLWASSLENPQSIYICRSTDHGQSWSAPENITATVWGPTADNPSCKPYEGGFIASGNGLLLTHGPHAGRILIAAALCRNHNTLDNFVLYSDDGGHTWHLSGLAYSNGDEAKLVELNDGRLLMSVRQQGARGYAISHDSGQTWGEQGHWPEMATNACNGDLIRYDDTTLLHSIPNSMKRENLSLFFSRDEGKTWGNPVTICAGGSAYSSLTLLPDGSIGIYYEKETPQGYELWFKKISR